ncbi:hypothetical protein F6X50_13485 [Dickeya dianthicola]|nr:hypothetical protein [Dickeya dianthicola]MZI90098.1 hypothetical protein [Dickeya dianthicola]
MLALVILQLALFWVYNQSFRDAGNVTGPVVGAGVSPVRDKNYPVNGPESVHKKSNGLAVAFSSVALTY